MKFKLMGYLLAVSIMSSVQAVAIINKTFGVMIVTGFGYQTDDGDIVVDAMPTKIYSDERLSTESAWGQSYELMTVIIYGKTYSFINLTSETVIIFRDGDNYDVTYERTEYPFCPVADESLFVFNNTSREIVLSEFKGPIGKHVRAQIDRNNVVLASGDKIELWCRNCRIDRMHVTGSPYCLKKGIFEDLNEFKDFPSAIVPALSTAKRITFFDTKFGDVTYKKSKTVVASCMNASLVVVNNTSMEIIVSNFAGKKVNGVRPLIERKPVVLAPHDKIWFDERASKIDLVHINGEKLDCIFDLADVKMLVLSQDENGMITFETITDSFDTRNNSPK